MVTQALIIVAMVFLVSIPILRQMYIQGKFNVDKPEKRTYMFEDKNGDRYNPFESPEDSDTESSEDEWKYSSEHL